MGLIGKDSDGLHGKIFAVLGWLRMRDDMPNVLVPVL